MSDEDFRDLIDRRDVLRETIEAGVSAADRVSLDAELSFVLAQLGRSGQEDGGV